MMEKKNKTIIGFAGRKRSGKTTICEYLKDMKSAEIITIANGLKNLCRKLFELDTVEEVNRLKDGYYPFDLLKNGDDTFSICIKNYSHSFRKHYNFKSIIFEETGIEFGTDEFNGFKDIHNMRELLQYVGTEIIRKHDPDWHCLQLKKAIEESESDIVVIDDIRFPNERKTIEELGGTVFFMIRPDMLEVSNHESETSLHWQDFDDNRIIVNNSTIDRMCSNITEYIYSGYTFGNDNGSLKSGLYTYEIQPYNLNFGLKSRDSKVESEFIDKYILNNDLFRETGIINLWIENIKDFDICKKHMFRLSSVTADTLSNGIQITLYNPFITENLKEWL